MKKIATTFLAVALFLLSPAEGYLIPFESELVLAAEYLYLIPLTSSSAYVTETVASGSNLPSSTLVNSFGGDSGLRILALFAGESRHMFAGSWSYFSTSNRDSINSAGPGLQAVILPGSGPALPVSPFAGSAASDLHLTYNDGDAVLRMPLSRDLGSDIYFLGGLQFLSLEYRQKITYFQSTAPVTNFVVRQRSYNIGAGLKTGVDLAYDLPPIFVAGTVSLRGKFSGALILAQNKSKFDYQETATPGSLDITNEQFTHLIPGLEAKIGLNYVLPFGNSTFALEVGYNLLYYKSVVDELVFPSSGATDFGRSFINYTDLALHGLYLGGGIAF